MTTLDKLTCSDLHCPSEIRFLLLPRIYGSIRYDYYWEDRYRVFSHACCYTCDDFDFGMRGRICSAGEHNWDDYHHCRFLLTQLIPALFLTVLAPIFWRHGVLPIQACTDVPAGKVQGVSDGSKIIDVLRRRHPHSHCFDHHQCLRVHAQFQQGIETAYQQAKSPQRRREDDGIVFECCWPDAEPNDD